jgi:hypothetical protein
MVQQPLPASALQIIAVYQDDSVVLLHGAQQGAALGPVLWLIPARPPLGPRAAPVHEQDAD